MTSIESGSASHYPEGIDGEPPVAKTLKGGIDSANDAADRALDAASRGADALRHEVTPRLKQGIDQAQTLIDQSMVALRDAAQTLREKAEDVSEQVAGYTRDEPMKALLIAAAVGAGLMGLLVLVMRSDD